MQRTPSRPSRARGSLFWKISLLLDQKEGVTTGDAQMGLKKWLPNSIHGQVHSAFSQTLGHILKTCKRTWVQVGHHLTLEVCNIHALTLRWGVWGQYRNECQTFFWLRTSGSPSLSAYQLGRLSTQGSALTASLLASGRVRAQRTTGVALSSKVRWAFLPGSMPVVSLKATGNCWI